MCVELLYASLESDDISLPGQNLWVGSNVLRDLPSLKFTDIILSEHFLFGIISSPWEYYLASSSSPAVCREAQVSAVWATALWGGWCSVL